MEPSITNTENPADVCQLATQINGLTPLTFNNLRGATMLRLMQSDPERSGWLLENWCLATLAELGAAAHIICRLSQGDADTVGETQILLAGKIAAAQICLDNLAGQAGIDLGEACRLKFNLESEAMDAGVYLDEDGVIVHNRPADPGQQPQNAVLDRLAEIRAADRKDQEEEEAAFQAEEDYRAQEKSREFTEAFGADFAASLFALGVEISGSYLHGDMIGLEREIICADETTHLHIAAIELSDSYWRMARRRVESETHGTEELWVVPNTAESHPLSDTDELIIWLAERQVIPA